MKKSAYLLVAVALFLGGVSFALGASTVVDDASGVTTPQPFSFSCDPYGTNPFTQGEAYIPNDGGACTFAIPQTESWKYMAIYKGTPGNSVLTNFGYVSGDPNQIFDMPNSSFAGFSPNSGDEFFSVSVGGNSFGDISNADTYFRTGAGSLPVDYSMVTWYWGAPATVTANNQSIYVGNAIPPLTATISGFVNGQTLATSDITGQASCTTTAPDSSTPGDYPITCTQGTLSSETYSFTAPTASYVAGDLHISTAPQNPPSVSITTPPNGAQYFRNDMVVPAATVTDTSPVATTTYTFNGATINPSLPLPFNTAPAGTSTNTLVVSASDFFGNTGYATSTFTVVPPDIYPPQITITSPKEYGIYVPTDSVLVSATVIDQSPIATTTYWLGTTQINPAQPLPLSTLKVPSVQKISVSASDLFGNTSTTTNVFLLVRTKTNCLVDIVSILVLWAKDKTLPTKPTLVQLTQDCSALLQGYHLAGNH